MKTESKKYKLHAGGYEITYFGQMLAFEQKKGTLMSFDKSCKLKDINGNDIDLSAVKEIRLKEIEVYQDGGEYPLRPNQADHFNILAEVIYKRGYEFPPVLVKYTSDTLLAFGICFDETAKITKVNQQF